jgi:hypothetical protein
MKTGWMAGKNAAIFRRSSAVLDEASGSLEPDEGLK